MGSIAENLGKKSVNWPDDQGLVVPDSHHEPLKTAFSPKSILKNSPKVKFPEQQPNSQYPIYQQKRPAARSRYDGKPLPQRLLTSESGRKTLPALFYQMNLKDPSSTLSTRAKLYSTNTPEKKPSTLNVDNVSSLTTQDSALLNVYPA